MNNIDIKCDGNENIHIDEFVELQGNLKSLSDEAYERLKKSIIKYGFRFPMFYVLLDSKKYILDGHGRLKTITKMIKEGFSFGNNNKLPAVKIDAKDKIEAKEILLALNSTMGKMSQEGFYDFINEEDFELDLDAVFEVFSPSDFDIDDYMSGYGAEIDDNYDNVESIVVEDEDKIPAISDKPVINKGDLIVLGKHRLLCGNSEDEKDIIKLLNGNKPSAVVTDPPYGISYQSSHRKNSNKSDTHEIIENDDIILEKWMPLAKKYSEGWIMFWVGWQNIADWIEVSEKYFGRYTNIMSWRKTWGMGDITGSFKNGEMGLVYNNGAKLREGKRPTCIFEGTMNLSDLKHPNQKPVSLFVDMYEGIPDGSILDLFGGSGSNLLGCEEVGRVCYVMEITPNYTQLIIDRYVNITGNNTIEINGIKVDWAEYKNKHNK